MFDGSPGFLWRERNTSSEPAHRTSDVEAYQHTANIKNDGAKFLGFQFLGFQWAYAFSVTEGFAAKLLFAARRSRTMLITAGSTESTTTTAMT